MGMTTSTLDEKLQSFITEQPMFFVATADTTGRVNVSPKGMDSLRIQNPNRILWLNVSGSGNETAAHVQATGRMTLMFCAFSGKALTLRTYGQARVYHRHDPEWPELLKLFPALAGSRQIFDLEIDLVQTSCGTGVPVMEFQHSRGEKELLPFFAKMGEDGVRKYWRKKNAETIDGLPTGVLGTE